MFVGFAFVLTTMFMLLPFSSLKAEALNRQLQLGMSGTDVSVLQAFLAKDALVYPQGLVTGYFGFLTKAAVSNFQTKNGISSVGRVGPQTLPVLNLQIATGGMSVGTQAPMIYSVGINVNRNDTTVSWSTNELAKGVVYYSINPLMTYEREVSVDVSGSVAMSDTNFKTSQSVTLQNLQANTTYYYLVYTTDQSGNVSVTWPSSFHTNN